MALLHYLWKARHQFKWEVIAAHAHHQLRGEEADRDQRVVRAFCQQKGIRFVSTRLNVKDYAAEQKLSIQTAARELRYFWLEQLTEEYERCCVATGHHGDDQVETMLMKQIRGQVPLHSLGIRAVRPFGTGRLVRPFLVVTKEQIEHYCKEYGIEAVIDSSNLSERYTRNRFRQQIIPFIKEENRQAHVHFQRQNEWLEEDHLFLMEMAEQILPTIIKEKK